MADTEYPILTLRKNEERRIYAGHLWAFSNELIEVPKSIPAGSLVMLIREIDKRPIGIGFFNPNSLIAFRLVTRDPRITVDAAFFEQKIQESADRRKLLAGRRNAVRLVHSESDLLPGLVIDQFNDVISFQISSAGFEVRKEELIASIKKLFSPRTIVEKNSSHSRRLEGLPDLEQLVFGTDAITVVTDEAGTKFDCDVLAGQKTGFYLDQMENRTAMRRYVGEGMTALDLFTNEGGFALNLALAGAKKVVGVDSSLHALKQSKRNALTNEVVGKIESIEADCFEFAKSHEAQYDVVVLDPPSLVKSKRDLPQAIKSYQSLNQHAMRLTRPGGVLFTASCSHHMSREFLLEALWEAARKSRRVVTILEERGAGIDHPVLMGMPETEYLHTFILRIH